MNSRSDLYRVRSLSECLRDVLVDAPEHPVLLHVMTQVEYWAKQTVRTMGNQVGRKLLRGLLGGLLGGSRRR